MSEQVAIVTGASRGIGAAIAERLAARGARVLVTYAGAHDAAEKVVARIARGGGTARAHRADVADPASAPGVFEAAERAFGPVDVLVNNAGIMPLAAIADTDDATFERIVAVNLRGAFSTMREAARRLRDGGSIVNVSSSVVGLNPPAYGAYAATKAAVETLTRILAKELGGRGIRVNCIAPGPTATELFFEGKPPELVDRIVSQIPLARLGTPADIAETVAYLTGEAAWISGQVLRVNGGMT